MSMPTTVEPGTSAQVGGDDARPGAQIDGASRRRQHGRRDPGELFGLRARNIDARCDLILPTTERHHADDPARRLAELPAPQPGLQRRAIGSGGHEQRRLLGGGDATDGGEPSFDGLELKVRV